MVEPAGAQRLEAAPAVTHAQGDAEDVAELAVEVAEVALRMVDDADGAFTTRVHRELVHRGFLTCRRPGVSVLRIDPALTIDRADIAAFLAALEEALAAGARRP